MYYNILLKWAIGLSSVNAQREQTHKSWALQIAMPGLKPMCYTARNVFLKLIQTILNAEYFEKKKETK